MHGIFLFCGFTAVAFVLFLTGYLLIAGLPAIRKIGLIPFLTGIVWNSTGSDPQYGIAPFILTSFYGTFGAIVLGVPVGVLTAIYLAKMAPEGVRKVLRTAVDLLAGIPSVVYGLVGMMVLVPAVQKIFNLPHGANLFSAILVLAVMMVSGNVANMPGLFTSVRFLTTAVASEMAYSSGLQRQALFSIALVLFGFVMVINLILNALMKKGERKA